MPIVTVPERLLPHLRQAAACLVSDHAERLHHEGDHPKTPDEWASFEAARADVERYLDALDDLQGHGTVNVPASAVAMVADEAAKIATYGLDDGVAMQELASTLEGLDKIAQKAELARELRVLADVVGGEN